MYKNFPGLLLTSSLALIAYFVGRIFPLVGGPVFALFLGMMLVPVCQSRPAFASGVRFAAKQVLQAAVILLGFGLNLRVIYNVGLTSLPIILVSIASALIMAYLMYRLLHIDATIATLIGVGTSICGGSAIAAAAPVVEADDQQIATSISVIFLFNVLAAILFPSLGAWLGFTTESGNVFALFAGSAINDTSSVTAAAATWDNLYGLGTQTLDAAVTVKLTRTLAILPIVFTLAWQKKRRQGDGPVASYRFPMFVLYFLIASALSTWLDQWFALDKLVVTTKFLSRFFILMAMAGIGLGTDLKKLIYSGFKPLLLGFICSLTVMISSLLVQKLLGLF